MVFDGFKLISTTFYLINTIMVTKSMINFNCPINCKCESLVTVNCSSAGITDGSFEQIYYKVNDHFQQYKSSKSFSYFERSISLNNLSI